MGINIYHLAIYVYMKGGEHGGSKRLWSQTHVWTQFHQLLAVINLVID